MKEISDKEDSLTRFLLGEVSEHERAEVEDRLLSDEEFYEGLVAVEGDLMDAYVRGELPEPERAQFEKVFFATARGRERVEFARGLLRSATLLHDGESAPPPPTLAPAKSPGRWGLLAYFFAPRPALSYAFAVVVLAITVAITWMVIERMRGRVTPQQARTEAPQRPEEQPPIAPPQQKEAPPSPASDQATANGERKPDRDAANDGPTTRPGSVFATITLMPGSLRDGAGGGNLFVPRAATHVRLRLQLEDDAYQAYRATISTPEGRKIWTGAARKDRAANAHSVTLTLPAASLKRGDYVVELDGAVANGPSVPAAQYSFRVTLED